MEKKVCIKTKDQKTIYGTLTNKNSSQKIVILVHGLTDHKDNHMFYNASKFFPRQNYATLKFNFYGWEKDARKFKDCDLQTHAQDLHEVINYCKEEFMDVHLVGHSLGCPTILLTSLTNVNSITFWDPSYDFATFMPMISRFDKALNSYIFDGAYEIVLHEKMRRSLTEDFPDTFKLTSQINKPIKIISAGAGLLTTGAQKYYQTANEPKNLTTINGATHCFDEQGAQEELFKETLDWVNKF